MEIKEGEFKKFGGLMIFGIAVLLLTRIDYLVNVILYKFGLQFSYGWYKEYSILYALSYQLVLLLIFLWTKNIQLLVILEAFILSAGQDLIYFGVWNLGRFPNDQWTWTLFYQIFGFWDTPSQFLLTLNSVAMTYFVVLISKQRSIKSVFR
jgi:hypothetical protein